MRRSAGVMIGRAFSVPARTSSSTEKYGKMLDAAPRMTRLFMAATDLTS